MHLSTTKLAGVVAALGIGAIAYGMIGSGVGANFVQSLTGTDHIQVGTFNCALSSTDTNVTISDNGHTASVTLPAIESSTAGSALAPLTVTNTGTIPLAVNWNVTTSGSLFDSGAFTFAPVAQNVRLNSGISHTYQTGFTWTTLGNADLGKSGTVTYSASCTEPSTSAHPDVSFWTQDGGTAAWSGSSVALGIPQNAPSSAAALIQFDNQPAALPTTEPTFVTDNYNAGSPRWYILFSNGQYVFGYPSNAGLGADSWQVGNSGSYVSWAQVVSEFGSAHVAGVSIVMDTDQTNTTDTISNVQYNGVTLVG